MNSAVLAEVLHFLSFRDRSVHEVEVYLNKRITGDQQSTETLQIIEYLFKHQLLDDAKFAKNWTDAKVKRLYGPRKITADLLLRGVAKSTINEALQTIDNEVWLAACLALLMKSGPKWLNLPKIHCLNKAALYLQSHGFNSSQVRFAVDQWYPKAVK